MDDGTSGSAIDRATDRRLARKGYWFDVEAADHVCDFFRLCCVHTKGEWAEQPVILEPWQRRWIRRLFGWKRPDGLRRYRKCFALIPRKNGKSLLAAGLGLYLLMFDGEPGAQVFSLAADKEQALAVFGEAKIMADKSEHLASRLYTTKTSLLYGETQSTFRVLSNAPRGKHGFNPHGVIFDELHEFRNRTLWDAMTSGSTTRRQPLTIIITTAGDDSAELCKAQYRVACMVRDGKVNDPEFLPVIYEAGPKDDWRDERTWYRANPQLGRSIKIDALRSEFKKAQTDTAEAAKFRRFYLNIWESTVRRWLPMDRWRDQEAKPQGLGDKDRVWYAGLDLSSTTDLTALVLVSQAEQGSPSCPYDVHSFFFCPEGNIEARARKDLVPYPEWVKSGHLIATPGDTVDYAFVEAKVLELWGSMNLREIAADPWNATQTIQRLDAAGVVVAEHRQGYKSMSAPSKELERLVQGRMLRHGGHPVLDWCAQNAVVAIDPAGNIKPTKQKSTERIDGVVALVMAIARASLADNQPSTYEKEGL